MPTENDYDREADAIDEIQSEDRQERMKIEKKNYSRLKYLRHEAYNKKNGCGLLVAIRNSKEIKCGDMMMGKKRFCLSCTANAESAKLEVKG